MELTGIPHQKTFPILTAGTVLDHYEPGVREWGSVVERLNEVIESSPEYEYHKPAPTTKEDKEHELAAWLNNLDLEGEEEEDFHECTNPRANPKRVELYRCTHCGNPSAVLRKCKCNKVRLVSDLLFLPSACTVLTVTLKVLRHRVSEAELEEAQVALYSHPSFLILSLLFHRFPLLLHTLGKKVADRTQSNPHP